MLSENTACSTITLIVWYAKDRDRLKYNTLFNEKHLGSRRNYSVYLG